MKLLVVKCLDWLSPWCRWEKTNSFQAATKVQRKSCPLASDWLCKIHLGKQPKVPQWWISVISRKSMEHSLSRWTKGRASFLAFFFFPSLFFFPFSFPPSLFPCLPSFSKAFMGTDFCHFVFSKIQILPGVLWSIKRCVVWGYCYW